MDVVFFEDDEWIRLAPLNMLKHTSLLRWGTGTLLSLLSEASEASGEPSLWGREHLRDVTESGLGAEYNAAKGSTTLMINSAARPGRGLREIVGRKGPFVAVAGSRLVAARLNASGVKPGLLTQREISRMSKSGAKVEVSENSLFRGYWDLVESNGLAIAEQGGHDADFLPLPSTARFRGPASNLRINAGAEVEDLVSFDGRLGPIVVDDGASIESFSRISGPCFIGPKAKVLSAKIGAGTSIFEGCKVGGEVENSIFMPYSNKAHLGYVGDSFVGEWVNLGAGSTFSNLKNTYGNVKSTLAGKRIDTGLLKLGPAVGDMVKISINATVFAGAHVGTASQVTGPARGDVPAFTYHDGHRERETELLLASVIETQRRVKERRGLALTKAEEKLIGYMFRSTAAERRAIGVRKGRIG